MDGDKPHWIKNIRAEDFFLAGDKTLLAEVMHPAKDALNLPYSMAMARISPGQSSLPHRLEQGELYFFLSGEGEAYLNAKAAPIGAQSVWYVPAGEEQWVKNTGANDLVFLCIVSPPWTESGEEILE